MCILSCHEIRVGCVEVYAVFVTLSRKIVDVELTCHNCVSPFGGGNHVEVSPGNHERNEDCEEWDVKAKEVENVLHESSDVKVCDYVYNVTGI